MHLLTLIWICVSVVFVESKTKFGDIIPLCSLSDVNVNSCLRSATQKMLPILAKGLKGWNIGGMDPIFVPSIVLGQDDGPISIRWEHINSTITGYSHQNVTGASVSKMNNIYKFDFNMSDSGISMIGKYKARGRMLFFPIRNEGHQEVYSGPSGYRISFEAKPEKKNQAEYLKIEKYKFRWTFSKDIKVVVKSNSKKPTPTDVILSKFLSSNAQELVEEMRPTFESAFGMLTRAYIQSFLNKIPLKDLFKQ